MITNRESGEVIIRFCHEPVRVVRDARLSRLRVTSDPFGETRTQQAEKDQTDINNIVGRYLRSGALPDTRSEGSYIDTSSMPKDISEAVMLTRNVSEKVDVYREEKAAKASAEAEADRAAGKAARMAQGAASKEGAPKGEAEGKPGGGSGGAVS